MVLSTFLTKLFTKILPYREIGWKDINETFYRFTLLKTPWFKVYLHRLICETIPDHCHDHPWNFWAIILWYGYWEENNGKVKYRYPGSVLYRPAKFSHKVWTGGNGSWSMIITGNRYREWQNNITCEV